MPADSTAPSSINDYSDIDNSVYIIQEKEDVEDTNPLYIQSDAENLYADGGKSEVPDDELGSEEEDGDSSGAAAKPVVETDNQTEESDESEEAAE